MASQITSVSIVYSAVCSGGDEREHQSSASLAFVYISVLNGALWDMGQVHCGIYEFGLLHIVYPVMFVCSVDMVRRAL